MNSCRKLQSVRNHLFFIFPFKSGCDLTRPYEILESKQKLTDFRSEGKLKNYLPPHNSNFWILGLLSVLIQKIQSKSPRLIMLAIFTSSNFLWSLKSNIWIPRLNGKKIGTRKGLFFHENQWKMQAAHTRHSTIARWKRANSQTSRNKPEFLTGQSREALIISKIT